MFSIQKNPLSMCFIKVALPSIITTSTFFVKYQERIFSTFLLENNCKIRLNGGGR